MNNNISEVTKTGMCSGCASCGGCAHISFQKGALGFPVPVPDEGCVKCGNCLRNCPVAVGNMDEEA